LEQRNNNLQEEVADLSARFVRLESEAQRMRVWYTGRIISVWEGFHQMSERMTRSMNAMVQVAGEDNAKHKRLVELMEETHLCLGIPFPGHEAPLPPAPTRFPGLDIPPPVAPDYVPAAFFEGMEIVPKPPHPPVDFDRQKPDTTMGLADLPADPFPSRLTPIPRTPPKDKDREDGGIAGDDPGPLPLPLTRRSGSMSVASTPVAIRVGGPSKRALSAVPEGAKDDNRPKKQRLV
jgi:hypothetical protein